jgi:hypothetical protein
MAFMRAWILRNRALSLVVLAVIVLAAGIVLVVALNGDDDTRTAPTTTATSRPTSTTRPSSTTAETTAPTSTTTAPADPAVAVWPFASSATRYTDPVAAVRGFAVDFVGFANPVLGTFRAGAGKAGTGEVDVRPRADGPVTTVEVGQLGTGHTWWVLGASTPNIELSEPAALATIVSPVRLQGRSTAFEGTVQTAVRRDGAREPLASGFVMGGGSGTLEPVSGTLSFNRPAVASGAVVLHTVSAENGQVWEATVVRIHFASVGG